MKNGKKRIAVVDEEPLTVKLIQDGLEAGGYEVLAATERKTALALLFSDVADLILLGVKMCGLDGYEICRRIRASSRVPIILLAARATTADELKGFEVGADDFVAKPVRVNELVARVRALLRRVEFSNRPDAGAFFRAPELGNGDALKPGRMVV